MKANIRRLLSATMAASMVSSMMLSNVAAVEKTPAVQTETETDETKVNEPVQTPEAETETAKENEDAASDKKEEAKPEAQPEKTEEKTAVRERTEISDVYTPEKLKVSKLDVDSNFDGAVANAEDADVDTSDPVIGIIEDELESIKVLDDNGQKVGLTEEQKQTVLGMFAQYQQNWKDNANVLGAQLPFYLAYNDSNEDGLGVLGEMLVLANVSVDDVRSGNYSYDDLTGMIMTFMMGDSFGVQFYGSTLIQKQKEALQAVKDSGAVTEYQKLLVLNDWLAGQASFDMSYIMNSGKEEPVMKAQEETKHAHYDDVYGAVKAQYHDQIYAQIKGQMADAIEANLRQQVWEAAIKEVFMQGYYGQAGINPDEATDEQKAAADEFASGQMEENKDAIAADPKAFVTGMAGEEAAAQIEAQVDATIEEAKTNGIAIDEAGNKATIDQMAEGQMQTEDKIINLGTEEQPYMVSPTEAVEVASTQAASQVTPAVLNYWKGNHFGALAEGQSVCLGYAKAYAYLVQAMHPEIYGTGADADMTVSENWKEAKDLYFDENGEIDINKGYVVDAVRITFDADVTMYGETQEGFNSDHFWNAVKVDGKWYYIDPCYTDTFSEVMARDRVETPGYINHLYFMFSHDTTSDLYEGYFSEIKSLYSEVATDKSYEGTWASRAASKSEYKDGNAYYIYDSTDLIHQLSASNSNNFDYDELTKDPDLKLVKHALTSSDAGDGDTDYEALIEFNHVKDEETGETVALVYNPETKEMEENELLTKIYAEHQEKAAIYPSINITSALSGDKVLFNLSKYILSYDLNTGEIAVHKSYDKVGANRDKTIAFGGMAFNMAGESGEFTFDDHPIAGMVSDGKGNLTVAIATNLGYISGKDDLERNTADGNDYTADSDASYGYEFEETNFNSAYSSYGNDKMGSMGEMFGYSKEINDNDEFMWVANVVGSESLSGVAGSTAEFDEHECEHHYVPFNETYFTKDDNGAWNTGISYICIECSKAVTEPKEPTQGPMTSDEDFEKEKAAYEKKKAEFDEVAANAGHILTPTDAVLNEDGTITFSKLEDAAVCKDRVGKLDVMPTGDGLSVELEEPVTVTAEITDTEGTCDTGKKVTYTAKGKTEDGHNYSVSIVKEIPAGEHTYDATFEWTEDDSEHGYSVSAVFECVEGDHAHDPIPATIEVTDSKAPTYREGGHKVLTATAELKDGDKVIATKSEEKRVELDKKENPFSDVPENEWYFDVVMDAYDRELMTGESEGKFAPDHNLSRGMVAVIMWRMSGAPEVEFKQTFDDVKNEEDYYAQAVTWAVENGLISGYDTDKTDGKKLFGPDDYVTREQLAVFFSRYAAFMGKDTSARNDLSWFDDKDKVSPFALSAMQWMVGENMIQGEGGTKNLNPTGEAQRSHMAKFSVLMDNFVKNKAKDKKTEAGE